MMSHLNQKPLGEIVRLSERKVLVIGGAGFIGSEVTRQLVDGGADVTVFDDFSSGKREYIEQLNLRIVRGDVCEAEQLKNALKDQEIVIHLAALPFIPDSFLNPERFFQINTMGSINVIWQSMQSRSVEKFVHISSSEVYGSSVYSPMDENHPLRPQSTYAISKLAADHAAFTMYKEHKFPIVIIRPFNSYGPNMTQPYIIPEIMSQLSQGNSLLKLGNLESFRDFTYVSDTARGIILPLEKLNRFAGEIINIGSGKEIQIRDLASKIISIMRKNTQLIVDEKRFRPWDVDHLVCDNKKAYKLLEWKPLVSLEEGLRLTVEWYLQHKVEFNYHY